MDLPPELWLDIFEFAGHIPEELNSDFHDPFVDPTSTSVLHLMDPNYGVYALRKAVSTRRAITLVCRDWCRLATPLLYRTVLLVDWHRVPNLTTTLDRSYGHSASQEAPALGHWARRLDLLTSGEVIVDLEDFAPVIAAIPHLAILHLSPLRVYMRQPTKLMKVLRDSCGASLRKLTWPLWPGMPCTREHYIGLLEACRSLRTFCYGPWRMSDACTFLTPPLPMLKFLSVAEQCDTHSPPSHLFPSLSQAFLLYCRHAAVSCLRDFLQIHSATLTTVYVNVSGYYRGGQFAFDALKSCANLVHLILFMPVANARDRSLFWEGGLPSVTHLGICCMSIRSPDQDFLALFDVLAGVPYPSSLKVFRIMNEIGEATTSDGFAACYRKLSSLEIGMEDVHGDKFAPPAGGFVGS